MTEPSQTAQQLMEKLDILLKKQEAFSAEIRDLQLQIRQLQNVAAEKPVASNAPPVVTPVAPPVQKTSELPTAPPPPAWKPPVVFPKPPGSPLKSNLEKFIGENLINKIGIAITIVGVAIGAKYAIDHQLISPLTRIVLGYLMGISLLITAIRLKTNYAAFSAVLLSGAMAILYFITYAAYAFYNLIPQIPAFSLMVLFTAFTVFAAVTYNRQEIAHIGLVGAYAVPFLLSEGSGKAGVLFSYMAVINAGILATAFKKYWKPLYYAAFVLTWAIFMTWFKTRFAATAHGSMAMASVSVFFLLFYLTFLAYKLVRHEKFEFQDIFLLLANAFVFYGFGYAILSQHPAGSQFLGLFTLANAVVHFVVSAVIYRQKLADRNLFYLVSGLVLVFITITIPVQLSGHWVTLLWAGEAALLFWIGRTRQVPVYETLSYPLMILAFFSIVQDWSGQYDVMYADKPAQLITPLFNMGFLSSLLLMAAFTFINLLNQNPRYHSPLATPRGWRKVVAVLIPAILLIAVYYGFRLEISFYWKQRFADSVLTLKKDGDPFPDYYRNYDLQYFGKIWVMVYSLLFTAALAWINLSRVKSRQLAEINMGLILLALIIFLGQGLNVLSDLRKSYLLKDGSALFQKDIFHIGIRYLSLAAAAFPLYAGYRYVQRDFLPKNWIFIYDFMLHGTILWVASSEFIHWMDMAAYRSADKLGLSILWGLYALILIALGIWKRKKHLRMGAMVLFAVTLLKLFFYDISHLNTISKTIVLVSLGLLLLIISFLYNKYKHLISNDTEA